MRVSSVLLTPVSPSMMHGTPHSIRSFMHSSFITKSSVSTNWRWLMMGSVPSGKSNWAPFELFSTRCSCSSMPRPLARYASSTRRSGRARSSFVGTCIFRDRSMHCRCCQPASVASGLVASTLHL